MNRLPHCTVITFREAAKAPPIDTELVQRALAFSEQLQDQVTAYVCGAQMFKIYGHAEAKDMADKAHARLIEYLAKPFGLPE